MAACSSNGMQSICFFIFYYYYFIIRDEFEFDDQKYCVLIFVLRLTPGPTDRSNDSNKLVTPIF